MGRAPPTVSRGRRDPRGRRPAGLASTACAPRRSATTSPPTCSSTSGSPPGARCATSSSRSRSRQLADGKLPEGGHLAHRRRGRLAAALTASCGPIRSSSRSVRAVAPASVTASTSTSVRTSTRSSLRRSGGSVERLVGAARGRAGRPPRRGRGPSTAWPGDVHQLVVVDVHAGYPAIQPERGSVHRDDQAGWVRQRRGRRRRSPTNDPRASPRDSASAGSATTTCSRSGRWSTAAQRSSTLPRSSSSGNSPSRPSGTPASTTTCTWCRPARRPGARPRPGGAGEQLVADDDGLPRLEGPAADRGPGALDVAAAQPQAPVLAPDLDRGAERLVGRLRRVR